MTISQEYVRECMLVSSQSNEESFPEDRQFFVMNLKCKFKKSYMPIESNFGYFILFPFGL